MTDYVGGPESNNFTGTAGNDTFTPGTGGGVVNGLGGIDTLNLNYSAFAAPVGTFGALSYSFYVSYNSPTLGRYFVNTGTTIEETAIYDIELLNFVGGNYGESVEITYGATLNLGLNLDGGTGALNVLILNYFYGQSASFIVQGGTITSNMGTFAQFGRFQVHLGGGNDTVSIDAGAMVIDTSEGNDTVTVGSGDAMIYTGSGADIIHAGSGNNQIMADGYYPTNSIPDNDADFVDAGAGNDVIYVGANDTVIGGPGTDTLWLNLGSSTSGVNIDLAVLLSGGTVQNGTGTISGIEKIGNITLGSGDDTFILGDLGNDIWGNSVVSGNGGNDTLVGGSAINVLAGNDGNDTLRGLGGNDILSGGAGDDRLEGGDGNDWLIGEDGADEILGSAGDDQIDAGNGNDIIDGGIGNDDIEAGAGDDQISGQAGDDRINAGGGSDTVNGGDGNDWLSSGDQFPYSDQTSLDTVNGDAGNDTITIGRGDTASGGAGLDVLNLHYAWSAEGISVNLSDILNGVAGANQGATVSGMESLHSVVGTAHADTIVIGNLVLVSDADGNPGIVAAGDGDDTVIGGTGNDVLNGQGGNDNLIGGAGNDSFDALEGNDRLEGGIGDDTYDVDDMADLIFEGIDEGTDTARTFGSLYLYANVENLTILGGGPSFGVGNELANIITGNIGDNLLIGGAGNDIIEGDQGNDLLYGETGADTLMGGYGVDYLAGGLGNDVLDGGVFEDALYGEDGDDILWGGDGFFTDILVGGAGNDTLRGDSLAADYDLMDGGAGDDVYWVDTGDDLTFEALNGGIDTVHADVRVANAGVYLWANVENLVLEGTTTFGVGNELDNTITGNASVNLLLGGAGNDTINGRGGNDVLFGEAGNDRFVFTAGTGGDVIGDFTRGQDRIDVSAFGFSFAQLLPNFIQNGNVGAINLGNGDFIVLHNVTMSTLTAADFIFAAVAEPAPKGGPPVMEPLGDWGGEARANLFADAIQFASDDLHWHRPQAEAFG